MTIIEAILNEIQSNPEKEYTVKDLLPLVGGSISNTRKALVKLTRIGKIRRQINTIGKEIKYVLCSENDDFDPSSATRWNQGGIKVESKNTLKTPSKHLQNTEGQALLYILYYLIINNKKNNNKNTLKDRKSPSLENFFPPSFRLEEIISPSFQQNPLPIVLNLLSELIPDGVLNGFEISPSIFCAGIKRTPVLDTDTELTPPMEGPAPLSPEELRAKQIEETRTKFSGTSNSLTEAFGSKTTKDGPVKRKAAKPITTINSPKLKAKEKEIDATITMPHIRYYGLSKEQRSFEFAKAFHKSMTTMFPAFRFHPAWQIALSAKYEFVRSGNFFIAMTKARIEADLLSARYEDYMSGICEYYFDTNGTRTITKTPRYDQLAGSEHVASVKDYIEQNLKGKILITPSDIKNSGHVDYLLPENFDSITSKDQYDHAHIFFHDVVFPELERVTFLTGHRLWDLISSCIGFGLIPRSWAEGFITHHHLKQLKGFVFKKPEYSDRSIFRNI